MSRSGYAGGFWPKLRTLHQGTRKGAFSAYLQLRGGDALWWVPSPVSSVRGLFFVVINGGQAQQGGFRLG